ncbi:DUF2339 domain-containing protein [Lacimicrobium alkaliphilum]|uniref:Membrane protein n=1 Tax=Lacimicrobium alkaliphilum TaxID=1526571 RepID=A0ABQ1RKD6_9ALTE|nr:DUF2339 domain-containing protein [Lacimicrobium alkaliphilum]GGD73494.1 membrane protein [Lacimicrobium alkaliphilum]
MEWVLLAVLACLFVFVGAILSFRNKGKIADLLRELELLRQQVNLQGKQLSRLRQLLSDHSESEIAPHTDSESASPGSSSMAPAASQSPEPSIKPASAATSPRTATEAQTDNDKTPARQPGGGFDFERFIKGNGLLWLGGMILAIGGIFLARYAAEAGMFPPVVRVTMGGVFGVLLVMAAEYLFRNAERFNIHSVYVCAALASGGVITCYAIVLVAYDYYGFIPAPFAFGLLAAVALSATSLSLRFGPLLAWIGIVGAYAVPVLVSTDSNNVTALLLYTVFISASAVWVSQAVNQRWLWWLSFAGHFLWMFIGLTLANDSHFTLLLVFGLLSVYLYVLSDILGWDLRAKMDNALPIKDLLMPRKEHLGVILPLLGISFFLAAFGSAPQVVIAAMAVSAVLCYSPYRHSAFDSWPFLALIFLLYGFTLLPAPLSYTDNLFPFRGGYLFIQIAALAAIAYSLLMLRYTQRPAWLLLLVLAPVSLFGISYALSADQASQYLYPVWAMELALLAIASSVATVRAAPGLFRITLTILANACITLCMTMLLDAATLSLAIAIQIASMSYLSHKYRVELPAWLYKAALTLVTIRLSFAPWLDDYAGEQILGLHWTIVIYPLVLATLWFARHYNPSASFRTWLEGAFVHVLALFVSTETSYLLVGHYPVFFDLSFKEAALLAVNWLVLAGVYLRRAGNALRTARFYRLFAGLLLIGAGALHLDISLASNPFIEAVQTGEGVFINWLLVLWALPALILLSMDQLGLTAARFKTLLRLTAGLFTFMYINGLIRGAWHDGALRLNGVTEQAELYAYSIVWLIIATAMIFMGHYFNKVKVSHLGFGILAMVLLKAFLIDMANLEGLYRAISFIGLGLSLVAIGWLFQKLNYEDKQIRADSETS